MRQDRSDLRAVLSLDQPNVLRADTTVSLIFLACA